MEEDSPSGRHVGTGSAPRSRSGRVQSTASRGRASRGASARRVTEARSVGAASAARTSTRSGRRVQRTAEPASGAAVGAATKATSVVSEATSVASATVSRAEGFAAAHRLPIIIAAVVIATVVMLYGPVRNLYSAWRSGLDLQATYAATTQSNDQLTNEVDTLMTPEGVQDLARERGYVGEGEAGVVVEGLSDDTTDATPMGTGAVVSADVPWYVRVADVIFQYHSDSSGSGN
ncbi:MAG: septum formation initiator family protein [Olsenella sp.]|nr:septum formation initiator family protein [Olsenella sp.]